MFTHKCEIEDQVIVAQRANPLEPSWSEWTLVVCSKCKALREWQHHSLEITATPTPDYMRHIYGLAEADVDLILRHQKKARRYNRYKGIVEEHDA